MLNDDLHLSAEDAIAVMRARAYTSPTPSSVPGVRATALSWL
jgi:hypothetical protein